MHSEEVTGKGVGTIGGIVGGAEIVLATESIIRVKPLWPWLVFPPLGAVGGGIGGYKLEKKSRGGAIALLITSMVAIIPTTIGTASAHAFHPEDVGAKKGNAPAYAPTYTNEAGVDISDTAEGTATEVQSRPQGIPNQPLGPPAPQSEPSDNTAPQPPPSNDVSPESFRKELRQKERIAHLSSGALLHLNRNIHLGLGIPNVDIFPVRLPDPYVQREGIELHIPLLAVDLP